MIRLGKSFVISGLTNDFKSYIHIDMEMYNYDMTPMQYKRNYNYCKNVNFQLKMFNVCLIFA